MDFLPFMEETQKENNIYFIHLFMIENVELRLIENGSKKYRDNCTSARLFMLIGNEYF